MVTYKCFEFSEFPNIDNFEDSEEYYDFYYSIVLEYPLIFLPNDKIIFWGLEVTLLKNEYNLLKELILLNTHKHQDEGYSEQEIIKSIDYKKTTFNGNKIKSYQRFIITSKSRIKKVLKKRLVRACLDKIIVNKYNPFIEGKEHEHYMKNYIVNECNKKIPKLDRQDLYIEKCTRIICKHLENDKRFEKIVLNANLNLVKIFSYMLNFTKPYNTLYSSFVFNKAFKDLIAPAKNQKHYSKHRRFTTNFIFSTEYKRYSFDDKYIRHREKDKNFKYAKITPTKFNLYNFVNYPTPSKK